MGLMLRMVMGELYMEARVLLRYKSAFFWVVVFPILFLGLMTMIFIRGDEEVSYTLAYHIADTPSNGLDPSLVVDVVNSTGMFKMMEASGLDSIVDLVSNGTVDVGLYVPEGFSRNITSMTPAQLVVVARQTSPNVPSVAAEVLRGVLSGFEKGVADRVINISMLFISQSIQGQAGVSPSMVERFLQFVADPLSVNVTVVKPPLLFTSGGMVAYYALGIVGIEALFIGLSMGAVRNIERKNDGTLKMLLASPQSPGTLFMSDVVVLFFYTLVSAVAVLVFGLLMGANYSLITPIEWAGIVLFTLFSALTASSIGLLLSLRTRTIEGSNVIVNVIAWPVMFLGGLTIPKEILPSWAQAFAEAFPLTRLVSASRNMTVYGYSLTEALQYALPAIVATLGLALIGWLAYRRLIQYSVEA